MQPVQVRANVRILLAEEALALGGVRLADRFAVPAGAFGVDGIEGFFVGFGGPFKSSGEAVLFDFVIVVDEAFGFGGGVSIIVIWRELVGVPVEVGQQWLEDRLLRLPC